MNQIAQIVDKTVVYLFGGDKVLIDASYEDVLTLMQNEWIEIAGYGMVQTSEVKRYVRYQGSHELEPRIEQNFPLLKDEIIKIVIERTNTKGTGSKVNKSIVANIAKRLIEGNEKKKREVDLKEKKYLDTLTPEQRENIKNYLRMKKKLFTSLPKHND